MENQEYEREVFLNAIRIHVQFFFFFVAIHYEGRDMDIGRPTGT